MALLELQKHTELLVAPTLLDYRLIVDSPRSIVLPAGILAPVVIDETEFILNSVSNAGVHHGMSFMELLRAVNLSTSRSAVSTFTHNARLSYGANIQSGYSPELIGNMFKVFDSLSQEQLIKDLIAEYPISLWGAITSMTPEDVAAVTAENMAWTVKAISENRAHMTRVSKIITSLMTYIYRSQRYDHEAREILEAAFFENGWEINQDSFHFFGPLLTMGLGYGGRMHDSGKSRILQVVYQPKPLTVRERDLVDRHVPLSLTITRSFINCLTYALLIYGPQYLPMWDIISNVSLDAIKDHHPERSGINTTLGDLLAVSDVLDVLTRPRIYKLEYKNANDALREMSGIPHLNRKIVNLMSKALSMRSGSNVRF